MSNNENIERIERKLDSIITKQDELDGKISRIMSILSNIEKNFYEDDIDGSEYDFEIVCPYCENEFVIDEDDNLEEVQCPECKNTIELDWSFDDENMCSGGNCPRCKGCSSGEEDDM